jgi:GT2 family glycosyltransferase
VYYYPAVEVLHYKGESSKQRVFKTTYEFYRAMYVFYQKHYAQDTPLLLRPVIVAGIVVQGGWALLRNALRPAANRRVC